jgi:pimeloyl-ACP methyl ester carboxylesterase
MRQHLWLVLPVLTLSATLARGDAPADVLDSAPSKFADFGDAKVHYKSMGLGETAIVFVHGWCCDHTVWRAQAKAFNGQARLLFIDLPGYGKSDKPKIDYTTEVFAKGIDAVLQDAGVKHAVLVGHSMGTPVVVKFYRMFPEKTQALVFVDGALRPFTKDPTQIEQFKSTFKEDTFKETAKGFLGSMTKDEALRKQIEGMVASTDPKVAISSFGNMLDPKAWKDDEIKVPAQALLAKSAMWTDEYKDFAKKLAPGLDYRVFDGVGHFLFMEKPEEFNAALAEFLKKQGVMK